MRAEIGYFVKDVSDKQERELNSKEIYNAFNKEYVNRKDKIKLVDFNVKSQDKDTVQLEVTVEIDGKQIKKQQKGNGAVDAFTKILKSMGYDFEFKFYSQEAQEKAKQYEEAIAITYVKLEEGKNHKNVWAVGKSGSATKSSLSAMISAVNRF